MPENSSFGQVSCTARVVPAPRRRAFTLVELLIVIIILAILGSIMLFAMFSSQEAARVAKTRNMISKLHALVMPKYESYMTRRVPIPPFRQAASRGVMAYNRLHALRDLMRMEMPERWSDLEDIAPSLQTASFPSQVTNIPIPSIARSYWRKIVLAHPNANRRLNDDFQGAECLYLIVSLGLDDPDGISQFSENEIGDIDGDGLKEFVDGWNRPISFLRWPAGFDSPLQTRASDEFQNGDPSRPKSDVDQFNPRRIDDLPQPHSQIPSDRKPPFIDQNPPRNNSQRGFAIYPLIYSGGPDQKLDLATGRRNNNIYYHHPNPNFPGQRTPDVPKYIDPYLYLPDDNAPGDISKKWQVGKPNDNDQDGDDNSRDNIHNHDVTNLR